MLKRFLLIGFVLTLTHEAKTQSGHIPPNHQHRTSGYGVCYGYAMGIAGNASGDCVPATIVRADADKDDANANLGWSVDGGYWTFHSGATLSGVTGGDIIAFGVGHVAYASLVTDHPSGGYIIQVDDIISWGNGPTTGNNLERVGSHPNLSYKRNSTLTASGYYRIKSFDVRAQNLFYTGPASTTTSFGQITIANYTNTSPVTPPRAWNQNYTATALAEHDYPTGYKQIFNNAWTKNVADDAGSTLQISVEVSSSLNTYEAKFYQAAGVTFIPVGGGKITVDGVTRTTSYTDYVRINPSPAEQASGTAVNGYANYVDYLFKYWTNSADTDTSYSTTAAFYPTAAVTYTAHFSAKPLPPPNVFAGGEVNDPVEITWTEHPDEGVTQYQIWRKIKPLGQGEGSPELLTTVNRGTTSCIDYGCIVTESYTEDLVSYDVRSYYSPGPSYSDPNYVAVFADSNPPSAAKDEEKIKLNPFSGLPTTFAVSSYPNPFNPSTTISYQLAEEANVVLHVFDMMGREVTSLVNDRKNAGYHSIAWHGKDSRGINVASGTYFYRFTASPLSGKEPYVASGKLLLTK